MSDKLKDSILKFLTCLESPHIIIVGIIIYFCISTTEQMLNGIMGTKFSIPDLNSIFQLIFLQLSGKYGIDSWLNSIKGVMPYQNNSSVISEDKK